MQGCILLMQGCVMLMQCRIENRQACIAVSQVHQHASSAIQSLLARQSFSAIKGAVSVSVLSPLASEGGRQGESCTRRDGRAGLPSVMLTRGCVLLTQGCGPHECIPRRHRCGGSAVHHVTGKGGGILQERWRFVREEQAAIKGCSTVSEAAELEAASC